MASYTQEELKELLSHYGEYDEKTGVFRFRSGHYEYFDSHDAKNPMTMVTEAYDEMLRGIPALIRSRFPVSVQDADGTVYSCECADIETVTPKEGLKELRDKGGSLSASFTGTFLITKGKGKEKEIVDRAENVNICTIPIMIPDGTLMTQGKMRNLLSVRDNGHSVIEQYLAGDIGHRDHAYIKTPGEQVTECVLNGLIFTENRIYDLMTEINRNRLNYVRANTASRISRYFSTISENVAALISRSEKTRTQEDGFLPTPKILDEEIYLNNDEALKQSGIFSMAFTGASVGKESKAGRWTDAVSICTELREADRLKLVNFTIADGDAPMGTPYRICMDERKYNSLTSGECVLARRNGGTIDVIDCGGGRDERLIREKKDEGYLLYRNEHRNTEIVRKELVTPVFRIKDDTQEADTGEPEYLNAEEFAASFVLGADSITPDGKIKTNDMGLIPLQHEGVMKYVSPGDIKGKNAVCMISGYQLMEPVMGASQESCHTGKTDEVQKTKTGQHDRQVNAAKGENISEYLPVVCSPYGEKVAKTLCAVSEAAGKVVEVNEDGGYIRVMGTDGKETRYGTGMRNDVLHRGDRGDMKIRVKEGDAVEPGTVLADSIFTENGSFSMALTLNCANISGEGNTLEDCAVISETAAGLLETEEMVTVEVKEALSRKGNGNGREFVTLLKKEGDTVFCGDALAEIAMPPADGRMSPEERDGLKAPADDYVRQKVLFSEAGVTHKDWEGSRGGIIEKINEYEKNGMKFHSFIISHRRKTNVADKIVDQFGNKKLVRKIVPDEQMPMDSEGNRVHIMMGPCSNISRKNLGEDIAGQFEKTARALGLKKVLLAPFTDNYMIKSFMQEADRLLGRSEGIPYLTYPDGRIQLGIKTTCVNMERLNRHGANGLGMGYDIATRQNGMAKTDEKKTLLDDYERPAEKDVREGIDNIRNVNTAVSAFIHTPSFRSRNNGRTGRT